MYRLKNEFQSGCKNTIFYGIVNRVPVFFKIDTILV
jgi:hypothetical protein